MKALLIVDVQQGLTCKKDLYQADRFIHTIRTAIEVYRKNGHLVVFIQHDNKQLVQGTDDWHIDSRLDYLGKDVFVQKTHGNAFDGTDLKKVLDGNGIDEILICGLVTHGCVRATCLGGLRLGYKVSLLKDGHTSWNKDVFERIRKTEDELVSLGVTIVPITLV